MRNQSRVKERGRDGGKDITVVALVALLRDVTTHHSAMTNLPLLRPPPPRTPLYPDLLAGAAQRRALRMTGGVCVISYLLSRPRPALPILAGLPDLLLPSPLEKGNKRKRQRQRKRTFCPARARALCSSIPGLLWRGLKLRFCLPLAPLPVAGIPGSGFSGVEGAVAPRTLRGGEGNLQPKSSASRPSHWCPPI